MEQVPKIDLSTINKGFETSYQRQSMTMRADGTQRLQGHRHFHRRDIEPQAQDHHKSERIYSDNLNLNNRRKKGKFPPNSILKSLTCTSKSATS